MNERIDPSIIQDIEEIGNGFSGIVFKSNYQSHLKSKEGNNSNELNNSTIIQKDFFDSSFIGNALINDSYDSKLEAETEYIDNKKDNSNFSLPKIIAHKSYQNLTDLKSIRREIEALELFQNCPWIVNMLGSKLIFHKKILVEASLYMEWMEYGSLKDIESLLSTTLNIENSNQEKDERNIEIKIENDDLIRKVHPSFSSNQFKNHNIKFQWPEAVLGIIASNVLKALGFMNMVHGMIHQDIKPSNILINRKGQVKLCDFAECTTINNSIFKRQIKRSCSSFHQNQSQNSKNQNQEQKQEKHFIKTKDIKNQEKLSKVSNLQDFSLMGTLAYMAPEKLIKRCEWKGEMGDGSQGENLDNPSFINDYHFKSDIWSLGMSLLEMALNKYPFKINIPEFNGKDYETPSLKNVIDDLSNFSIDNIDQTFNSFSKSNTNSSSIPSISSSYLNNENIGHDDEFIGNVSSNSPSESFSSLKTPPIQKIQITLKDGYGLGAGSIDHCRIYNNGIHDSDDDNGPMAFIEMSESILNDPIPKLNKEEGWSDMFNDFLSKCLIRSPQDRATHEELLVRKTSSLSFSSSSFHLIL